MNTRRIYIGTDGGATTSKIGAVWRDGTAVSTTLLQRATGSKEGPAATVAGWVAAVDEYLAVNGLTWDQVEGAGLAVPGPFQRYGVFDHSANLPDSFTGFDVYTSYLGALAARAGRAVPVIVANDGNMGGVAEAQHARGNTQATVLMLAPGSGLGCAFIDGTGLALEGDTLAGMEAAHMPAPLHLLGNIPPYPCGCTRTWGCVEVYTTISGLPYLLTAALERYPDHQLARATDMKQRVLSLRGLAQQGDSLALEIFDGQARALGLHVATLAMALDPAFVVIGGGLMDPEATTAAFRTRYLENVRAAAAPYLWPTQRTRLSVIPAVLGDLSQAIGAALAALYQSRRK